ncbi:unnamed protein product [Cylicocyclus nassatus]|uniref:Uncharacterized protein n=1 Tax=Cylicocyclus nassatus TaxID=53992 RepID=A0AA36DVS3_CYLNA|nr:unnamed protein product [Cylicocyclus nassatus]
MFAARMEKVTRQVDSDLQITQHMGLLDQRVLRWTPSVLPIEPSHWVPVKIYHTSGSVLDLPESIPALPGPGKMGFGIEVDVCGPHIQSTRLSSHLSEPRIKRFSDC